MKYALHVGGIILIWVVTALVASELVPENWQIFTGYVGGIFSGMILMTD